MRARESRTAGHTSGRRPRWPAGHCPGRPGSDASRPPKARRFGRCPSALASPGTSKAPARHLEFPQAPAYARRAPVPMLALVAAAPPTVWPQVYDPLHRPWLSTLLAAVPVVVLLGSLGLLRLRAHTAALLGLATALAVAVL